MKIDPQHLSDNWPRDREDTSAPAVLAHALLALTGGSQPTAQYTQASEQDDGTTAWRVFAVAGDALVDIRATCESWAPENARLDSARMTRARDAVTEVRVENIKMLENGQAKVTWFVGLRDDEDVELPVRADRSFAVARERADNVALALVRLLQGRA